MSFLMSMAEIGTIASSIGVAMIGVFPTLGMLDSEIEQGLYHGNVQVVMAVFIRLLVVSVISLFTILMKTISKGHEERDVREHAFSEVILKVELALQENTKASQESTKIMYECVHAMEDMEAMGKACLIEQGRRRNQ